MAYLLTGTLYFLCKFIALGAVAFGGVTMGISYRKKKNAKANA